MFRIVQEKITIQKQILFIAHNNIDNEKLIKKKIEKNLLLNINFFQKTQ